MYPVNAKLNNIWWQNIIFKDNWSVVDDDLLKSIKAQINDDII